MSTTPEVKRTASPSTRGGPRGGGPSSGGPRRASEKDVAKSSGGGGKRTPARSAGGAASPSPAHFGIVVSVKENFGFIRGFGLEDDLFFPIDSQGVKVGQEVSFAIRGNDRAGGKPMAVQVTYLDNGSFLQKLGGDLSSLPAIEGSEFARGEVLSIGPVSGTFQIAGSGKVAVFPASALENKASGTDVSTLGMLSCKVLHDPNTGIWVVSPPFRSGKQGMKLAKVVKLPQGRELGLLQGVNGDSSEYRFGRDHVDSRAAEIRVGDIVWFDAPAEGSTSTVSSKLSLCTPVDERPFYDKEHDAEGGSDASTSLKGWLNAPDQPESKRVTGVISSLQNTFAFVKASRDTYFMPYSELCAPTADFTRGSLKASAIVTFEVKKATSSKDSDIATRVFLPPFPSAELSRSSSSSRRKQTEICLKENVQGVVSNVGDDGAIRTVQYDGASVLESPELWEELNSLTVGESKSFKGRGNGIRVLLPTYCSWVNARGGDIRLKYDEENQEVKALNRAEGEVENDESTNAIISCSAPIGDSRSFTSGDKVTFDLYIRLPSGKRVGFLTPPADEVRRVTIPGGEEEMGVVLAEGFIVSNRRLTNVYSEKGSAKVGDVVRFSTVEDRRRGPLATNVQVVDGANPSNIGLHPLYRPPVRLQGIVSRQMSKVIGGGREKGEPTGAKALRESGTSTLPSGLILVGREPTFAVEEEEEEEEATVDWRKDTELLRMLRTCSDRPVESEEPLHVFAHLTKHEVKLLEKEAKKQGMQTATIKITPDASKPFSTHTTLALGRNKQVLGDWAAKMGRSVRLATGVHGEGMVVDYRIQYGASAGMLTVRLTTPVDQAGSDVKCVDVEPMATFLNDSNGGGGKGKKNAGSAANDETKKKLLGSLRRWIQKGVVPEEAAEVQSPTRLVFPISEALLDCLVQECLVFKVDADKQRVVVSCDTAEECLLTSEEMSSKSFEGQFAFLFVGETSAASFFPVEGDSVEFTPCRSTRTGILRATDIKLVKARSDRVVGAVEELNSKGGWVRPHGQGKLSAEFTSADVLSRFISVGDVVDFKLSEKGDKASKVRVLQAAPQQSATPLKAESLTTTKDSSTPAERPRINQELIANAPTATSAAASKTAPGPDGTIGFTKDKWRNKRALSTLSVAAPEFKPSSFLIPTPTASPEPSRTPQPLLPSSSPVPLSSSPGPGNSKPTPKINIKAPAFVPSGVANAPKTE